VAAAANPGSAGAQADAPGTTNEARVPPPPEETLATSSLPVEVPVPRPEPDTPPTPEPSPAELPKPGNPELTEESPDDGPDPNRVKETQPDPQTTPNKPAFRGNQQRTVLRGSLSRTGRSALDVENTPLGRYQAQISRAVELEWQRNCVRYRDFITPGFVTVRFFVDSRGKVGRRDFVGSMQAGEHQKGFTLDSIRDARIPPMPPELGKEFKDEPLELIFNFYF
jgi:outer membrane biosynthesis protein TonB